MTEWIGWTDIEEKPNYNCCGVFKVRAVNSEGFPVEVPRCLQKDKDGIIYIGHSENVRRRITFFLGAIEGKEYTSPEGRKLFTINRYTDFRKSRNHFKLQYSFKRLPNKKETKQEWERLLKLYFKRYGEVPPVNNNLPHKYISWEDLSTERLDT
jgi:predicted GIY-YIG superfamily endonuclease